MRRRLTGSSFIVSGHWADCVVSVMSYPMLEFYGKVGTNIKSPSPSLGEQRQRRRVALAIGRVLPVPPAGEQQ